MRTHSGPSSNGKTQLPLPTMYVTQFYLAVMANKNEWTCVCIWLWEYHPLEGTADLGSAINNNTINTYYQKEVSSFCPLTILLITTLYITPTHWVPICRHPYPGGVRKMMIDTLIWQTTADYMYSQPPLYYYFAGEHTHLLGRKDATTVSIQQAYNIPGYICGNNSSSNCRILILLHKQEKYCWCWWWKDDNSFELLKFLTTTGIIWNEFYMLMQSFIP
jgi:hypothetical protein